MTDVSQKSMSAQAEDLGVIDALLFRRVSPVSWAHLGGFGRGRGWAGIVDVDDADEPMLATIPAGTDQVHRFDHAEAARVLGPYYARSGALVQVGYDVVVVLGNPAGPIAEGATDEGLRELAGLVDRDAEEVTPSKRLGDELEILHAVRAVITSPIDTLSSTMTHILQVTIESLSCELGVLRSGTGFVTVVDAASAIHAQTPGLGAALDQLEALCVHGTLRLQEIASGSSLLLPQLDPRIRSLLALPIAEPLGGTLVVAHTSSGPRGFTTLCQRLGEQLVDTASVIGYTAALRDDLRRLADQQRQAARTDSLTGLGNRLLWEEAVTAAQAELDAGTAMTVITLDLDGLKAVNDGFGHDAGDDLLRRCADVLRAHCREGDVAVRLGGDEFALLLPLSAERAQERLTALTQRLSHPSCDQVHVAASLGAATARPGQRLRDALRAADTAMYTRKRARVSRPPR